MFCVIQTRMHLHLRRNILTMYWCENTDFLLHTWMVICVICTSSSSRDQASVLLMQADCINDCNRMWRRESSNIWIERQMKEHEQLHVIVTATQDLVHWRAVWHMLMIRLHHLHKRKKYTELLQQTILWTIETQNKTSDAQVKSASQHMLTVNISEFLRKFLKAREKSVLLILLSMNRQSNLSQTPPSPILVLQNSMHTQKEISIVANYHLAVASEEVLWRLLLHHHWWMLSDFFNDWKLKESAHKLVWRLFRFLNSTNFLIGGEWWELTYMKQYVRTYSWHNIVPLVLRESFASLICWNTVTPTFEANYFALWDDNTTPTDADTTLWNETLRWTFSDRFSVENVAYLDKYFSSSEVGWNSYLEAGVFVDWTASADTWYLLSRILISESMSVNETLTINCSFSIN